MRVIWSFTHKVQVLYAHEYKEQVFNALIFNIYIYIYINKLPTPHHNHSTTAPSPPLHHHTCQCCHHHREPSQIIRTSNPHSSSL
ncbi:hypothetical protein Hanom_Chr12g01161211 [Helianthus anomalus]